MKLLRAGLLAGLTLLALPAAGHEFKSGSLEIDHPWARQTAPSQANGSAYFTIHNRGNEPDRLVGVQSGIADTAELHSNTMDAQGVMRMRPLDAIEVPAGGEAALEPGGNHVMLMGLKHPLDVGTTFPLTLVFEKAGEVPVEVKVESIAYRPVPTGQGMHDHGQGHGTQHMAPKTK
jgi:copper(I)-binding protein